MSKFVLSSETLKEELDWGNLAWLSHPPTTNSEQLTVIDVELFPGKGHDLHKHPDQEEVIFCVKGTVEQWIGEEKRTLKAGDAVYIDTGVVHGSFNDSDGPACILVILSPCIGEIGYELIDVANEEPWSNLR
jgi:quercetin dioxygenase-like cupin family protein